MTASDGPLAGKVAVVTGGGRGLGRSIALALAESGAAVVVAARASAPLQATASQIVGAGGVALGLTADVTDEKQVEDLFSRTVEQFGGLDNLVDNAGVLHEAPISETTFDDWQRVVATNLTGLFLCCRTAFPHFPAAGPGKVLNISSIFGFRGVQNFVSYSPPRQAL
jgi:NAD(P)-dependent dehydrogenase (short-subunit alcohol dehydrogenase family)